MRVLDDIALDELHVRRLPRVDRTGGQRVGQQAQLFLEPDADDLAAVDHVEIHEPIRPEINRPNNGIRGRGSGGRGSLHRDRPFFTFSLR